MKEEKKIEKKIEKKVEKKIKKKKKNEDCFGSENDLKEAILKRPFLEPDVRGSSGAFTSEEKAELLMRIKKKYPTFPQGMAEILQEYALFSQNMTESLRNPKWLEKQKGEPDYDRVQTEKTYRDARLLVSFLNEKAPQLERAVTVYRGVGAKRKREVGSRFEMVISGWSTDPYVAQGFTEAGVMVNWHAKNFAAFIV